MQGLDLADYIIGNILMVSINPQWPILGFRSRLIRICRLWVSGGGVRTLELRGVGGWVGGWMGGGLLELFI